MNRNRRNRAVEPIQGVNDAVDGGRIDERPRGVMDQYIAWRVVGETFQAKPTGFLPGRAAMDRRVERKPYCCGGVQFPVVRVNHHTHRANAGMIGKDSQRMAQHGRAAKVPVLLGNAAAGPHAASTGHDKRCCFVHRRLFVCTVCVNSHRMIEKDGLGHRNVI
jgi:hypothetical protein